MWMTKDTNGLTVLAAAVASGREETVEVLLCAMMRTLQDREVRRSCSQCVSVLKAERFVLVYICFPSYQIHSGFIY